MIPLFLASKSSRRAALLKHLGLTFEIHTPHGVEKTLKTGSDDDIINVVCHNALQKAFSVLPSIDNGFIIGGDTLVVTDTNLVLGKPKTSDEALQMLQGLAGKQHRVISAVAIVDASSKAKRVGYKWTTVTFRKISDDELRKYVLTQEPIGKAGGYAIQGKGGALVESINGSYTAVIGLPIELVVSFLSHFGLQPNQY
ncbi:MAG: Maf family protein [Candidatus Hermodarchaeia archaeon]|jgi:septum formation protein